MSIEADRIMFEIYRDVRFDSRYRVVYFTELDEHNRETEINRAMEGEHVYSGFLAAASIESAKAAIAGFLDRVNDGHAWTRQDLEALLAPFGG